jgi:hypothetical protein
MRSDSRAHIEKCPPMPAFHAILVSRDEGDIIAQTLDHLLTWCDSIYIYVTGSLDDTWAIVLTAAARDPRIIPVASQPVLFVNGLRAWVFDRFRSRFRPGDWIARVDADEFYHIPPPQFITEHVAHGESRIHAAFYDFVLTRTELRAWQEGIETRADRNRPIESRRRHFRFDPFPELRLFRYRRSMRWSPAQYDPFNAGLVAQARIPIRHYRARDPIQAQVRCAIRAATARATAALERHWHAADWRQLVCRDDAPRVMQWPEGQSLPPHPARRFPASVTRLPRHLFYGTGLVSLRRCAAPARCRILRARARSGRCV